VETSVLARSIVSAIVAKGPQVFALCRMAATPENAQVEIQIDLKAQGDE
jgi:hypothetical protein